MITITALKWVPPFAQGQVRDHRIRWVLNEVGWDYEVDLLDARDQKSAAYRAEQPFGQVPIMRETGRPTLFESGAIVVDVATRAGKLLPADEGQRALALSWVFAAVNSIEPSLMNLAEVDFFIRDEEFKALRRPGVVEDVHGRLEELATALGERDYLVGSAFTVADLMTSSVLRILRHTDIVAQHPTLVAYRERCVARPACQRAIAEQLADFARHSADDMHWDG